MPETCEETEIESALGETRYLLERWKISVSTTGFLWIEPTGKSVSPEELAGLLALLARGCDAEYPKVIKVDFAAATIVGEQWTLVESLLTDFATTVRGQIRYITGAGRPAAVLIMRSSIKNPFPTSGGGGDPAV